MSKNHSGRRFGKNLAILAVGELLTRILTFVAFVHLARVLGPETFGLVEVALAVLMVALLLVDQGFPTLGAREVARNPEAVEGLVGRVISVQLLFAVVTYAILAIVVLSLPLDRTLTVLLLGLGVSLLGTPFLLLWVFQGRKQMTWVALPQVMRQLVFAAVVLVFVRKPEHVLRLPIAEIVAVATAGVLFVIAYRRAGDRLTLGIGQGGRLKLLVSALPIGGSQMIWVLRMYLPTILLATMVEQSVVGSFGVAHRLMMVIQTLLGVYFINLFPTLSETAQSSPTRLAHLLHRSLSLVTWPVLAGALVTTFAAHTLIGWVFGESYLGTQSVSVLAILIWIVPIIAWRRHLRSALIALDRQRADFVCSLVGLLLLLGLLPLLTLKFGAVGTAWAMVASELLTVGWTYLTLRRYVGELRFVRSLFTLPLGSSWSSNERRGVSQSCHR